MKMKRTGDGPGRAKFKKRGEKVEPVTIAAAISAAIAATAADGLKEVGKKAVLDSYEAVKKAANAA
jgi:hypothetical protein